MDQYSQNFNSGKGNDVQVQSAVYKNIRFFKAFNTYGDLQQVMLNQAAITDLSLVPYKEVLSSCESLEHLDLSKNFLTMDSCSDICELITTMPNLSFISLEGNDFAMRSVGYFMTAIMERHSDSSKTPLGLLNLRNNPQIAGKTEHERQLTFKGATSLWKFLQETG